MFFLVSLKNGKNIFKCDIQVFLDTDHSDTLIKKSGIFNLVFTGMTCFKLTV